MIVAIGQLIICSVAAIALPFVSGGGAATITVIIAELLGALLGVNQFFDFIKKGSAVKFLCWAGALVDLIVSFALFSTKQSAGIALLIAFIGFPIGWLVVVMINNAIQKSAETLYDVADTTHNIIANCSPTVIFYCSSCNATYSEKSSEKVSCPKCGKPLVKTKIKVEQWREYSPEQKDEIKAQLQREQAGIIEEKPFVQDKQQVEKRETTASKNLFCRKCGAKIPSDSAFCPECGERVIKT